VFHSPKVQTEFWSRVERRGAFDCWPWTGTFVGRERHRRYGVYGAGSARIRAHRLSWEIANDTVIPAGHVICHACDHPWCVNPRHLWVGTQRQNISDAESKGRMRTHGDRTYCPNGHLRTAENTHWQRNHRGRAPYPRCRDCARDRSRFRSGILLMCDEDLGALVMDAAKQATPSAVGSRLRALIMGAA